MPQRAQRRGGSYSWVQSPRGQEAWTEAPVGTRIRCWQFPPTTNPGSLEQIKVRGNSPVDGPAGHDLHSTTLYADSPFILLCDVVFSWMIQAIKPSCGGPTGDDIRPGN